MAAAQLLQARLVLLLPSLFPLRLVACTAILFL